MWRDIHYSVRQLYRNKLVSAIVILLLGIGIGANTTIFSFVNALLLKPLPVRHPENLFLLEKMRSKQVRPDTAFFYRQFEEIAHRKDLFSSVVAEQDWSSIDYQPFKTHDSVRLVLTQIVSPSYFSQLGVNAFAGRVLTEADASASSNIPVVLSYQFWQSEFKGADMIGQTIRIKNYPFLVVGVLPREFHSLDIERAPDIRVPISAAPVFTGGSATDGGVNYPLGFSILTRLASGVSPAQAAAAITPLVQPGEEELWRLWNARRPQPWSAQELEGGVQLRRDYHVALQSAARGASQLRDQFSRALFLLTGAVGLLLLAICANVMGLLLAKAEERRRENAVRLSMGASRGRLLRQLLIENLLLGLGGAALGTVLAYGLCPLLARLLPPARGYLRYQTPRIVDVGPDIRVLLFAFTLSLIAVLVFGLLAAWRGTGLDLNAELKSTGRNTTSAIPGLTPVAVQVALSVVLLTVAALMLRTFWNLEHLNPGFDRAHIIEFTIDPWSVGYSDEQARVFFRELKPQVEGLPGIRSVAYASMGIMLGVGQKTTVAPQGVILPQSTFLNTSLNSVTSSYFDTMGIPLLAGRNLTPSDMGKKPAQIVVNLAFADFFFPHDSDVVGKAVVQGIDGMKPPTAVIVGVVGTAKYRSVREDNPPIYYGAAEDGEIMYVRSYGNPVQLTSAIRRVLAKVDRGVPLLEVSTLEQKVQNSLWQERLVTLLSGFFAAVTLMLAAIGLYGALAYSVARRTRELGIRIAIGAQIRHIVQTVCGSAILALGLGLLVGLSAAIVLAHFTRSLLYGVDPLDLLSLMAVAGVTVVCAAVAAAFPALRAIRMDPSEALREE